MPSTLLHTDNENEKKDSEDEEVRIEHKIQINLPKKMNNLKKCTKFY